MNKWFAILGGFLFLSIFGAIQYYVAKKAYRWLCLLYPQLNVKIYTFIYVLLTLTMFFSFVRLDFIVIKFLRVFGSYYMGFFAYLLLCILASDAILLLGRLFRLVPSPTPKSASFFSGLFVLLTVMGLFAYGAYHAKQIQLASYTVSLDKKHSTLTNLNLVFISDLHLGHINDADYMEKVARNVNQLNPDLVCIGGDVFNDDFNALSSPEETMKHIRSIQSKYGVYACLGNHDTGSTFNKMMDFMEQCGIQVLKDEYAVVEDQFVIVGRNDSSPIGYQGDLKRGDFLEVREASIQNQDSNVINDSVFQQYPLIVMDHQPSNINEYGKETDLLLCGHTHKGQMFPFSLITDAIFVIDHGHYQKEEESPHVIVTSGVGTWGPPLRVGTDSEIVTIKVVFQ